MEKVDAWCEYPLVIPTDIVINVIISNSRHACLLQVSANEISLNALMSHCIYYCFPIEEYASADFAEKCSYVCSAMYDVVCKQPNISDYALFLRSVVYILTESSTWQHISGASIDVLANKYKFICSLMHSIAKFIIFNNMQLTTSQLYDAFSIIIEMCCWSTAKILDIQDDNGSYDAMANVILIIKLFDEITDNDIIYSLPVSRGLIDCICINCNESLLKVYKKCSLSDRSNSDERRIFAKVLCVSRGNNKLVFSIYCSLRKIVAMIKCNDMGIQYFLQYTTAKLITHNPELLKFIIWYVIESVIMNSVCDNSIDIINNNINKVISGISMNEISIAVNSINRCHWFLSQYENVFTASFFKWLFTHDHISNFYFNSYEWLCVAIMLLITIQIGDIDQNCKEVCLIIATHQF